VQLAGVDCQRIRPPGAIDLLTRADKAFGGWARIGLRGFFGRALSRATKIHTHFNEFFRKILVSHLY
jgi:hypothetical protein